jgi:hypothetical protein
MVGEMKHNAFPGRHIDTNKSEKIDGSGLLDVRVLFLYLNARCMINFF